MQKVQEYTPAETHAETQLPYASVAVIGMGYVGLPLALRAEEKGYSVVGIDISAEKIELLRSRTAPFETESHRRKL